MTPKHRPLLSVAIFALVFLSPFAAGSIEAQEPAPSAPLPSRTPAPSSDAYRLIAEARGLDVDQPSQAFQVHLLVADVGSGETSYEGLSKHARKALEDLQDFLPFTSYRLLDFAWLRSSGWTEARLRGPDDKRYRVSLGHRSPSEETGGQLFVSHFELTDRIRAVNEDVLIRERVRKLQEGVPLAPMAPARLISTSFRMDVGETVVVGTSRLDGERKALVVLLTAIP